ncbi:hypothetical protein CK203_053724 [Vitis vinifera]|uniref:Uncharacterized protein n=1 Tax=Vitis vinifera TaxID=29760 RepID=A0A438FV33_VITVI|nr:hypothetical protein CK203_053724 [Vitis vinifera]
MRSPLSFYKSYSFSTMFFPFVPSFSLYFPLCNSPSSRTLVGANHTLLDSALARVRIRVTVWVDTEAQLYEEYDGASAFVWCSGGWCSFCLRCDHSRGVVRFWVTSASSLCPKVLTFLEPEKLGPRPLLSKTPPDLLLRRQAALISGPAKAWRKAVQFYSSVFQDLIVDGYLTPNSKSLCVETSAGQDVFALREIGVVDAIGTAKKKSPPLVVSALPSRQPFDDDTFDFVFSGGGAFDKVMRPLDFASEIARTLKPEGFLVFIQRLKMKPGILSHGTPKSHSNSVNKCSVPGHKKELFRKAEPLIPEEPLKPWITLKRNIKNIKYLPSMADISFKQRYVYIDVGARSYGSSIGSWFRKQYPKQNKTFEVYAIEADKTFHDEYKLKKRVTLLPYAAWVRNETLSFRD